MANASDSPNLTQGDPLKIARCPECGYALAGLPFAGKCPECGWEFVPGDVVLYGWSKEGTGQMRIRDYFTFLCVLIACVGVRHVSTPLQDRALAIRVITAGFVLVLVMFGWMFYRTKRARGDNGGPWQLRIGPRRYAQRFGEGRVKLTPWSRIQKFETRNTHGESWEFRVVRRTTALSWRFKLCEVDVKAPEIMVTAKEADIRELMRRAGDWIGNDVVWRYPPDQHQFANVCAK